MNAQRALRRAARGARRCPELWQRGLFSSRRTYLCLAVHWRGVGVVVLGFGDEKGQV